MIQGIELVDWRNKDEVIKFYEANKHYLDNYQSIVDLDSQLGVIDLKISYCNALIGKRHYSECLETLTHLNIMINKLKNDPLVDYSSRYEKYLFTEGIVFGYLKRYEESQDNFKELVEIDPKNDLYKDWFESNKIKIIAKQSNIVGYTGFGIIVLNLFLDLIFKIKLGNYVDLIGLSAMIFGFSFPYIKGLIIKIK